MSVEEKYVFHISKNLWETLNSAKYNLKSLHETLISFNRDELIDFQYNLTCAAHNLRPTTTFFVEWGGYKEYYPDFDLIGDIANWTVSMGQEFYETVLSDIELFKRICISILEVNISDINHIFELPEWDCKELDDINIISDVYGLATHVFDGNYGEDELFEIVYEMIEINDKGLGSDENRFIKYTHSY